MKKKKSSASDYDKEVKFQAGIIIKNLQDGISYSLDVALNSTSKTKRDKERLKKQLIRAAAYTRIKTQLERLL